jgi:hypothetical protein
MSPKERVERIMLDYLKQKGIDPEKLDNLSEEEFKSLCTDAQIDAYMRGKLDESKRKG